MEQATHPIAAAVSYNKNNPNVKGIQYFNNKPYLYLSETFVIDSSTAPRKRPENVVPNDPNWQLLLSHKVSLEKVVLFAGKKSSGALEIIELACESFNDKKNILYFVLCWHDLSEKIALLQKLGIPEIQYTCYKDGHLPCEEIPLLKGYLYHFLETRK